MHSVEGAGIPQPRLSLLTTPRSLVMVVTPHHSLLAHAASCHPCAAARQAAGRLGVPLHSWQQSGLPRCNNPLKPGSAVLRCRGGCALTCRRCDSPLPIQADLFPQMIVSNALDRVESVNEGRRLSFPFRRPDQGSRSTGGGRGTASSSFAVVLHLDLTACLLLRRCLLED